MLKRIAYLLLLLPAITMAQPLDKVVAVVNDGVITASELEAQVVLLRQQISAKKMQVPSDVVLRKQVLQHLIDVDLELQLAKQNSLVISNKELDEAISKIAESNKLSLPQLREAVSQQGLAWNAYREDIRKEMLIGRLQQKAVGKDITITPQQVEDYLKTAVHQDTAQYTYHLQNVVIPLPEEPTMEQLAKARQKAVVILARIRKGDDLNRVVLEESEGESIVEAGDLGERHLAELPEIFAREVTKMKAGQVSSPLRTGNGYQLIKLISIAGSSQKHEVVKTHVRHILLKPDTSMTATEAKAAAANLLHQINAGKDFFAMAKKYSLDPGSAAKGGDLGWVSPGDLVPEVEKAMDALPLHKVSKPVKSAFGWHLIEVLERKKTDDSVSFKRQQARLFLQQKKFSEAVQNWQQHLRAGAYIKVMDKELA